VTPPSALKAADRSVSELEAVDAAVADEIPFTETETVSTPPNPLGPSIISVDSVLTSPSIGDLVPPLGFVSHEIGVSKAPPRLSSEPKDKAAVVVLLHATLRGSTPECPFERTLMEEGSGMAGGRGNICAPDET
jgi:hypothetical protein